MTDYRPLCTVLFALLVAPGVASAQVLRCEDANGRVTYTNTSCPNSKAIKEVVPPLSAQEKAQQDAQYRQALERKREEQQLQAERDAAQRKAEAERAAARAAQQPAPAPVPPVVVQVPPAQTVVPSYGPFYPPRPPHVRPYPPQPQPPRPPQQSDGYNCNVFRCYDGKGNTWSRP